MGNGIFAARIDSQGTVVDPLGIPLGVGDAPAAILSVLGGCVVMWHGNGLEGRFIPDDPAEELGPHFSIRGTHRVLQYGDEEILVLTQRAGESSLDLYDAGGRRVHSLQLDPSLFVIDVVEVSGRRIMLTATEEPSEFQIYEIDAEFGPNLLGRTQESVPSPWYVTAVAPTEAGLIAVGIPSDQTVDWVEYSLAGEVVDRGTSSIEYLSTLEEGTELPFEFEYPSAPAGLRLLRSSDPRDSSELTVFPGYVERVFDLDGDRRIFLSQSEGALVYELDRFDGDGDVLPLAPGIQRLLDSAVEGDRAVLLWANSVEDAHHIFAGWFDVESMTLVRQIEVSRVRNLDYDPSFGIAISGERVLVAWLEAADESSGTTLVYRRASLEDGWLEAPQILAERSDFTSRNLIRFNEDFLLVYERDDPQERRIAVIQRDGGVSADALADGSGTIPLAVVRVEDGLVVAGGEILICPFTCPGRSESIQLTLDQYDSELLFIDSLPVPEGHEIVREFGLEARDGDLALATGETSLYYEKLGPSVWASPVEIFVSGTEIEWLGPRRYVLVHHEDRFDVEGASAGIVISDFELAPQREMERHPELLLRDSRSQPWWFPQSLHEVSGRLLLFAAAATSDPAAGYVPRLRAHEIAYEQSRGRRRPVSR